MYLIILLYPVEDLILYIMLFLLANLVFHQLLDIHTVRKKAPEKFRFKIPLRTLD